MAVELFFPFFEPKGEGEMKNFVRKHFIFKFKFGGTYLPAAFGFKKDINFLK